METCQVQAQHNAGERKAEERDVIDLVAQQLEEAAQAAAGPVVRAIWSLPKQHQTAEVYQQIIAVLQCQMQEAIPNRQFALDGILDAFIGLDTK